MAETVGFEPTKAQDLIPLAGVLLKPLGHISIFLARVLGFEPRLQASKARVLPVRRLPIIWGERRVTHSLL